MCSFSKTNQQIMQNDLLVSLQVDNLNKHVDLQKKIDLVITSALLRVNLLMEIPKQMHLDP
ncbi:hypothetical protein RchiOBHm_Chr7g0180731 [Rosa chinensis]|uniref:Uncharacterized protein n=1 Tax=Rosa chinensis TaxID=74649 RepID=A0A2P6P2G7_ROSCH|nr:hypothetical protein RchiOBHm_Chr7g0180731 [Rosa chinensis]